MRILVVGHSGQLATSLRDAQLPASWILHTAGRPELDVLKAASFEEKMDVFGPDVVINTAAWTAVDAAEEHEREAYALNRDAPSLLARVCARHDIPLIHISTDYVFDGKKGKPYTETDETNPLNVYGRSKLAGEEAVRDSGAKHVILRVSWLFGPYGHNFLRTMVRLASERESLNIVADQHGAPTCTLHLADALLALLERWQRNPASFPWNRTWHLAGAGYATWFDLAREIMDASQKLGGPSAQVNPITTAEYPTPATRPMDSRLDCSAIEGELGICLPPWQEGVMVSLERLYQGGSKA